MLRMAASADQRTLRKGCWGWYHRTWAGRMGAPRAGHVKAVTVGGPRLMMTKLRERLWGQLTEWGGDRIGTGGQLRT